MLRIAPGTARPGFFQIQQMLKATGTSAGTKRPLDRTGTSLEIVPSKSCTKIAAVMIWNENARLSKQTFSFSSPVPEGTAIHQGKGLVFRYGTRGTAMAKKHPKAGKENASA